MNTATTTNEHGERITATVGKGICFKADVEQSAVVKKIRLGGWNGRIAQVCVDIEDGEYRGKDVWLDLAECW